MNRIRRLRKAQGMTQTDLAIRLNTSVATISRLESADIRLSADWLMHISQVLGAPAGEIMGEETAGPDWLGRAGTDGLVRPGPPPGFAGLIAGLNLPCPLLAAIEADQGPFRAGDILVADRLDPDAHAALHDRVCLAGLADGRVYLGRLLRAPPARFVVVPLKEGLPPSGESALAWAARPVMSLTAWRG